MGTTQAYVKRVELPASPEVVFRDLLQPANVTEYDSRFRSWQPREMPPHEGTKVDFVAKIFGLWAKGTSEFVVFEPPRHVELRLVRPPGPFDSRLMWHLEATPTGTSFEYRFEIAAPFGLGWLGSLLLRQFTAHLDVELPALVHRY